MRKWINYTCWLCDEKGYKKWYLNHICNKFCLNCKSKLTGDFYCKCNEPKKEYYNE